MDPIAWDICYGLPNQQYIDYVSNNLLHQQATVDPFAPFLMEKANGSYISRSNVESELRRPENRIILGKKGSGKTALARWLIYEMYRYQTLVVRLPSSESATLSPSCQQNDRCCSWTLSQIIAHIFDTYWNQMIVEPLHSETLLPLLRRDREWMLKLHWFYNHYPPRHYQVLRDFELFTWLNSTLPHVPFNPQSNDRDILREIIRFIVTIPFDPTKIFGEKFHWPYQNVMLLFDLGRDTSVEIIAELAQITQELQHLSLAPLRFKIFLNAQLEHEITSWSCVKSGYVSVYRLPPWSSQELQDILDKRIIACGGNYTDNTSSWTSLPGLVPAVRYHFRQILIDGALRAYKQPTEFDAPIHALKLARGLLAACAGCWPERFPPPLNAHQLLEIINLYWAEEKGEEM